MPVNTPPAPVTSLLALDIGGGTRDLLLWQAGEPIENAIKMVMPSPTQTVAARIRRATAQGRPIFLSGWLMGGGAMGRAVTQHLAAGLAVAATPQAAASLNDELDQVRAMGVEITDTPPQGAAAIPTSDWDLTTLRQVLAAFEAPWPQTLAAAVCDHGYSPGYSNRKFRFEMWRRFLEQGGGLEGLVAQTAPPDMTRLAALIDQAPGSWVMDTAAAALWGALEDPAVAALAEDGVCVVNLGNMHTVGFLVRGQRCLGIYEHHTGCLDAMKLADQLDRFMAGGLGDQEVFDDNGHGCCRRDEAPTAKLPVVVTGPRRAMVAGLGWAVAAPHGDVMLSGCFGLLAAVRAQAR